MEHLFIIIMEWLAKYYIWWAFPVLGISFVAAILVAVGGLLAADEEMNDSKK